MTQNKKMEREIYIDVSSNAPISIARLRSILLYCETLARNLGDGGEHLAYILNGVALLPYTDDGSF